MNLKITGLQVDAGSGEGSRGGRVIGHDGKGNPIYASSKHGLPPRTGATMGEAIAMSSPSGGMSKRSKKAATERLSKALFGEGGLKSPTHPDNLKISEGEQKEKDLKYAKFLRGLAAQGMGPRKHTKEAEKLEAKWK